jgi:hypothetical protein
MKFVFISLVLCSLRAGAQIHSVNDTTETLKYYIEGQSAITSKAVPFWMRTNNYGSNPVQGASLAIIGGITKPYKNQNISPSNFDWGAGFQIRGNAGGDLNAKLLEGYLKAKWYIFQLKAGRTKDMMGLADSTLSSGSFAISGNSLGIPKVEIAIPEYWTLPFAHDWLAIKGTFAHGWLGDQNIVQHPFVISKSATTNFHQKSFYGRLGKPGSKLSFYGGFNHQVFFGDESKYYRNWNLSPISTYLMAITGGVHKFSKIGNHLGSIDQGIEINLKRINITTYHEFFYDVGGLIHLNNIKDGLFGVSLKNKILPQGNLKWKKVVFEFLSTKSQGGEIDAKLTPSGDENYYNNDIYTSGWTYKGENLGSNFLTNVKYARPELINKKGEVIINTRVLAIHAAIEGSYGMMNFILKGSMSRNFGNYASSSVGTSTGTIRNIPDPPYFSPVSQFSGYLELSYPLKNNLKLGLVTAGDYGNLLINSGGSLIKISKTW